MPDITDKILAETAPNPLFNPLPPTVGELTEYRDNFRGELAELMGYCDDLEYQGNQITIEWAISEMKGHQMNWVRVGLVADRVRRYRLYRGQYPNFRVFCQKILGKHNWQVNKIINYSLMVVELIDQGFEIVPTCMAQAEKLWQCCHKSGALLVDAWATVTDKLPESFLITAKSIGEVLGFPTEYRPRMNKQQRRKIQELADRDGMNFDEKLDELIALDETSNTTEQEDDQTDEDMTVKEQVWREDMEQLVEEHDRQLWFLAALARLFKPIANPSQFSWLRKVRYQT